MHCAEVQNQLSHSTGYLPHKKKKKMLGLAQVPGSCWYNDALAKIRVHPFAFPPTIPASLLG